MGIWSILGDIGKTLVNPLASVLGGLIGSSGQSSANEANLQATRETNAQNYKIFQEQLGYNTQMWNAQNEYNTPKHQRQMYENAGVNPYFALGNITSGQAQQIIAPSSNPMQASHFENAANPLGSGIAQAGQQFVDSMLKKEQISGLNIDNQMKAIDLKYHVQDKILDLQQKRKNIESSDLSNREKRKQLSLLDYQIESAQIELKYLDDYLHQRNEGQKEMTRKTKYEADEAYWKSSAAESYARQYPKLLEGQVNLLVEQANEARSASVANRASARASEASARYSDALTTTEDKLRFGKKLAQDLNNDILRGQIKLQDLNLSLQQLEDLRKKDIVEFRNGHWLFRLNDTAFNYVCNTLGKVFSGSVGHVIK